MLSVSVHYHSKYDSHVSKGIAKIFLRFIADKQNYLICKHYLHWWIIKEMTEVVHEFIDHPSYIYTMSEVYSSIVVSVNMFMCVFVNVFVKDFSVTTALRISKFGTNVGYDLMFCVKEKELAPAYHSLYLSVFPATQ